MYDQDLEPGTDVVLITVDATRWDAIHRADGLTPAPFLSRLFEENFTLTSCFSTGYPTQFALPGLISSTLPLDYGGYDYGIRDRPTALAEVFHERGYDSAALVTGFMTGRLFSYDRGFQTYCNLDSIESWLDSLGKLYLRYWKSQLESDGRENETILESGAPFLRSYLAGLLEYCELRQREVSGELTHPRELSPRLHGVDFDAAIDRLESALEAHRRNPVQNTSELAMSYPDVPLIDEVLDTEGWDGADLSLGSFDRMKLRGSMLAVAARPYLGSVYRHRGARSAVREALSWPRLPLVGTESASAGYILQNLRSWISDAPGPRFTWAHLADAHSNNYFSWEFDDRNRRSSELAAHYEYLSEVGRHFSTFRSSPEYDLGLRLVDHYLERFVTSLQDELEQPPLIVITADHGQEVLPLRSGDHVAHFYDELLHIPVAFVHPSLEAGTYDGLCSSIDIAPTMLDILGIDVPKGFDGCPVIDLGAGGRDYVVAEDYQRGPVDPVTKDPKICVRTADRKVVCSASEPAEGGIQIDMAFSYDTDPNELFPLNVDHSDSVFREELEYARIRSEQISDSIRTVGTSIV